jgi:hypothetical protein
MCQISTSSAKHSRAENIALKKRSKTFHFQSCAETDDDGHCRS